MNHSYEPCHIVVDGIEESQQCKVDYIMSRHWRWEDMAGFTARINQQAS